jgi:hypothetical protein
MAKGGSTLGVPMQITILMTLLALLPTPIMSVTPFLRISIVLHFLRQALGANHSSNQVLVGLSMFLTMIIVGPVFSQIHANAWVPMEQGKITQEQAIEEAGKADQSLSGEVRPGKSHQALPRNLSRSGAAHAERPRSQSSDSRLHHFRIEDRLSDRRGPVSALPGNRHRGGLGYAIDRHGAVAAGHAVGAIQDPAVRAGGWMEPADRFLDQEFLLTL